LNWIFVALLGGAVLTGAFNGSLKAVTDASISSATNAVTLAVGLVGQMAIWLGFMRVLQDAGLMASLARGLRPLIRRLFPEVPADHPALGAMILNLSANILGLGNAATPFGLKAMVELERLNPRPGVATNAMALFLAINTSGLAILPLTVIGIRAAMGSKDATGIILPTLMATTVSAVTAVVFAKFLQRLPAYAPERFGAEGTSPAAATRGPSEEALAKAAAVAETEARATPQRLVVGLGIMGTLAVALVLAATRLQGTAFDRARVLLSEWMLPVLMLSIATVGFVRGVKVYESFLAGAKEAFQIATSIIPFLVAILVAVGMFRAAGALDAVVSVVGPWSAAVGVPAEALPMAFIRPLSGSGATAILTETMKVHGPDSLIGWVVSVMNGSTETTFYMLAVYYGAVGVKAVRHTVPACLAADVAGLLSAAWFARMFHHG
jgi:spore maturation protein SpmA